MHFLIWSLGLTLQQLARDTGLVNATLKDVSTADLAEFDWTDFVTRESCIRLVAYIYNLDSAYAMFCCQPPRLFLRELQIDLTAPEVCFEAVSAEECFIALRAWRQTMAPNYNPSLCAAVKTICNGDASQLRIFAGMSVLNMFTIVSALFAMTFHASSTALSPLDTSSIQAGLDNWVSLWPSPVRDEELSRGFVSSEPNKTKVGFMRHAPEYWLITSSILARIHQNETTAPRFGNCELERHPTGMAQLQALVNEFRSKS
ncbi:hypothetical protein N7465_001970 [Penicillium sp. CMV-2018d]|nr:hypothetical protein N7465_001970 [Penicillium sp. CMV-2018d]